MKNILFALLFLFSSQLLFAQFNVGYRSYDSIAVFKDGAAMENPWAGGFSIPQFSNMDLDGDGKLDLVVFDRDGHNFRTFINKGIPNTVGYVHEPQYQKRFPEVFFLGLLRDFDLDGKMDLYSYAPGGFSVHKNTSSNNTVSFSLEYTLLQSVYGSDTLPSYLLTSDIPHIGDLDDDGDLDMLSFGIGASLNTIEHHNNLAVDLFSIDTLFFNVPTKCWGSVTESTSSDFLKYTTCKGVTGYKLGQGARGRHIGSTILAIDTDDDGDRDLILGDAGTSHLLHIINEGDKFSANLDTSQQTIVYPPNTTPVNVRSLPAAYYVDINNDGTKDLLVAPAQPTDFSDTSLNVNNNWYYKNNGSNTNPDFEFISDNFLGKGMIEVGDHSTPIFFDVDGDSLTDILIGNEGYFTINNISTASLAYYKNIGSDSVPAFLWVTNDYANLSALGLHKIHPSFGDMDGDGDSDMILGDDEGYIHYFKNISTTDSAVFVLDEAMYMDINVSFYAAPFITDVNSDNLPDILLGDQYGTVSYYENKGTDTLADFNSDATIDKFGNIQVGLPFDGYSVPWMTDEFDETGKKYLFVAGKEGKVYIYTDLFNLSDTFNLVDSIVTQGYYTTISGTDLFNSGDIDFVFGEKAGGITFMTRAEIVVPGILDRPSSVSNINLYPNPTQEQLTLNFDLNYPGEVEILIHDLLGRPLSYEKLFITSTFASMNLDVSKLGNGTYFLILKAGEQVSTKKFVKLN